ncbi:MAG: hypothetical protein ACE5I5_13985 [Candidatus Heimdallarchaeota archaeon]
MKFAIVDEALAHSRLNGGLLKNLDRRARPRKETIAVFNEHAEEYDRWYQEEPGASDMKPK